LYIQFSIIRIIDANGNPRYYENASLAFTSKVTDAVGNSVTFGYDANTGNRTSIQRNLAGDSHTTTTSLTYNTSGNITSISDPLENTSYFDYDTSDNLASFEDPAGNTYAYGYNGNDNLTSVEYPDYPQNGEVALTYGSYGQLQTLTDARNKSYGFTYDSDGNLETATNPSSGVDSYTYDDIGRVISHTDPKNNTYTFTYDGKDRVTQVTYPNNATKVYTYDCCRLGSVTIASGTVTLEHNEINRLTSVTDIYDKTIAYDYDYAGNLTSLTYPGNKVVTYTYDPANRLTSVTDWLNNTTTYDYSLGGNLVKVVYPDGSILIHQFDDADRLTAIWDFKTDATVDASFEFSLNSLGNRTGISYHQPLNAVPPTQSVTNTFGNDNRMLTMGSATFDFDNTGNVITKTVGSAITTYSWNYDNVLTQEVSGSNTYSYTYDGLGNRVAKVVNSTTTRYVVEPRSSTVLAETDASGNITAYYVYGLGLISKITPSDEAYFYHYDGLGSIVAMTDSSGSVVNKYSYDAYGKVLNQVEAVSNPFKYVGLFGVMDEGNGLLYMRARYYDTEMRRFLNKDPIGLLGGLNMYAYVGNNPISWIDPLGLDWFRPKNDPYVVGRDDSWLVIPGHGIGKFIDDYVPAGHTFGTLHDALVDMGLEAGLPDWLINIPTMPGMYVLAVGAELDNSLYMLLEKEPLLVCH